MELHHDHRKAPVCSVDHGPLAGLRHRTVIDARVGSSGLALWQEEHLPGFYVPPHRHDCEEIISVVEGLIEAEVGGRTWRVEPQQSVIIPPWELHAFQVASDRPVRLLAIFASPRPRIFNPDGTESTPPWEGGEADHLLG